MGKTTGPPRASLFAMLLIDAANVVGSRPDGWWKDRPGAARRLVEAVRAAMSTSGLAGLAGLAGPAPPVVVVLEGAARHGVDEGASDGVTIVHAPGHGDDTLVGVAAAATEHVVLVSADRALGERCRAVGAEVVGPSWLLDRLTS